MLTCWNGINKVLLVKELIETIDWGDGPPSTITSQAEGDVWIDYHDPSLLKVYTYIAKQGWWICLAIWKKSLKVSDQLLIQMLKIQNRLDLLWKVQKQWLLYLAIGLLIVWCYRNGFYQVVCFLKKIMGKSNQTIIKNLI